MLEPMALAGTMYGVAINHTSPGWLVTLLLVVLLTITSRKMFIKVDKLVIIRSHSYAFVRLNSFACGLLSTPPQAAQLSRQEAAARLKPPVHAAGPETGADSVFYRARQWLLRIRVMVLGGRGGAQVHEEAVDKVVSASAVVQASTSSTTVVIN